MQETKIHKSRDRNGKIVGVITTECDSLRFKKANDVQKTLLIKNEAAVLKEADGRIPGSFKTPVYYFFNEGLMNDKSCGYSCTNYIKGKTLDCNGKLNGSFVDNINKIAKYVMLLRKFKVPNLPHDSEFGSRSWINKMSTPRTLNLICRIRSTPYSHKLNEKYDCSKLKKTIEDSIITKFSFNHYNVSPRHIIQNDKNELYLIGFDWATNKLPEHYDIARLASEVAIKYKREDLAKTLLTEYKRIMSQSEPNAVDPFNKAIYGLLALNSMREMKEVYRDAKNDKNDLKRAILFAEKIENKNLLN